MGRNKETDERRVASPSQPLQRRRKLVLEFREWSQRATSCPERVTFQSVSMSLWLGVSISKAANSQALIGWSFCDLNQHHLGNERTELTESYSRGSQTYLVFHPLFRTQKILQYLSEASKQKFVYTCGYCCCPHGLFQCLGSRGGITHSRKHYTRV